jgi:hypothetical protein
MSEKIIKFTEYKATLPVQQLRCNYDPDSKKTLSDGVIVSNKGVGFKYSIKLINNKIYKFDLSKKETKFMVNKLIEQGKLLEVGEIEEKIIENINDEKVNEETTVNTKEIPNIKPPANKPPKIKEKKEKKEPKNKDKDRTKGSNDPEQGNKSKKNI